jgi:hypothetical protein
MRCGPRGANDATHRQFEGLISHVNANDAKLWSAVDDTCACLARGPNTERNRGMGFSKLIKSSTTAYLILQGSAAAMTSVLAHVSWANVDSDARTHMPCFEASVTNKLCKFGRWPGRCACRCTHADAKLTAPPPARDRAIGRLTLRAATALARQEPSRVARFYVFVVRLSSRVDVTFMMRWKVVS